MFWVNLYSDGATFETDRASEACQPVSLSERSSRCLSALCRLESFEVSSALAELFLAGVTAGERAARTGVSSRGPAGPAGGRTSPDGSA
jgi:hypothetical protein